MPSLLLRLVSLLVPFPVRDRWCEEWRAELRHGGWRMLPGALPDAWTMRTIGREDTPPAVAGCAWRAACASTVCGFHGGVEGS